MFFKAIRSSFNHNKRYSPANNDYLILDCEVQSRKGVDKTNNEDSFLVNNIKSMSEDEILFTTNVNTSSLNMFAICDGITAGGCGKESSQMAVQMLGVLQNNCCNVRNQEDFELFLNKMDEYVQKMNKNIFVSLSSDGSGRCGSTLALLVIFRNQVVIYNVGDSRIYRMRDNLFVQLTKDHTVADYKRRLGFFCDDPYITDKDKNTLYQYLGQEKNIDVYKYGPFTLNRSDQLLICSDGISGVLEREALSSIIRQHSENIVTTLIELATQKGSQDDKTGIFIAVR